MFRTEKIERLVKYAIMTGFINRIEYIDGVHKKEIAPVSLMIVAPPESNKTSILKQFEGVKCVKYTVDLSSKPLIEFLKDAQSEKYYHLIVPDFIKIVRHGQQVTGPVIATLNALIEEGVRTSMYYGQEINLKKNVKCGLISSITPTLYNQQFKAWNDMGFLSRFLTVSYEYSDETRSEIMKIISGDGHVPFDETVIQMRRSGRKDVTINKDIAAAIRLYTEDLTKKLQTYCVIVWHGEQRQKVYLSIQGFRLHNQIRLLMKAMAYDKGLAQANYECLEELKNLLEYVGMPDNPKVL